MCVHMYTARLRDVRTCSRLSSPFPSLSTCSSPLLLPASFSESFLPVKRHSGATQPYLGNLLRVHASTTTIPYHLLSTAIITANSSSSSRTQFSLHACSLLLFSLFILLLFSTFFLVQRVTPSYLRYTVRYVPLSLPNHLVRIMQ